MEKSRVRDSFDVSSFTLFVDCLPRDVGPSWFRSFFSKFGFVKKSYIPNKYSKRSGCRFGFITFGKREDAEMAIAKTRGLRIDNRCLFVKMASFTNNPKPSITQVNQSLRFRNDVDRSGVAGPSKDIWVQNGEYQSKGWKKGFKSFSEVVKGSGSFGSVIKLEEIGNEWLLRSATAKLAPSKSLVLVQDQLKNLGHLNIQVRPMGGDFLVLTFPTVDACNSVFSNGEFAWFQDWFLEIHKWDKLRVIPPSRSVWLNCYGVPLHLWNSVTFKKLGQIWGNVLQINKDTIQETSFSVGKILISTQTLDVINQVILVENGGVQFKIRVCEEQIAVNTILRAECNCKGCNEEGKLNIEEFELVNDLDKMEQFADNRSEQGNKESSFRMIENSISPVLPLENKDTQKEDDDVETSSDERKENADVEASNRVQGNEVEKQVNLTNSEKMSGQFNEKVAGMDALNSSLGIVSSAMEIDKVLGSMGNLNSTQSPSRGVCLSDEVSTTLIKETQDLEAVITENLDEADITLKVVNSNHCDNSEEDTSTDPLEQSHAFVHSAVKSLKGKKKRKNINDILGFSKVKPVNTNMKVGDRKKNKCVVLRSAVAAAALSASISSNGINNRNRILLDEAQAIWAINKMHGINYDGDEQEVISRIANLDAQDKGSADCHL